MLHNYYTMWPQEFIELKHIENLLVCGICYEFMDTSVITSCSHSYCSLCIRKYLHYKTQCPVCFAETFEKDLRKNKVLDEIITHFSQIKDKLKRSLQIQIHSNIPTLKNNTSPSINIHKDASSPGTSGIHKIPLIFTPKSSKRPITTNLEESKVVMCPVCKVTVCELNINRHLDDCLKRESMKEKPQITASTRKPLPKLVFNLMKDAVLKKKLKEFGLPTNGDRRVLETRLQRYIVLYNAECDKSNPRPVSELIKQCDEEENLERKINKTLFLNKLQVTRNTEQNVVEEERKKYLEAHKDSFESLIEAIKSVGSSKKSSVRRSLLHERIQNNEEIPQKRQVIAKNLDDSIICTEKDNSVSFNSAVYIPDSDSDTSCPLQMYSSTDPKAFLNIELSPASNALRSKTQISDQENVDREESMLANCSSIKINNIGQDDNSDACSDTSVYNNSTQSVTENKFFKDTLKNDSKNSSSTPRYKKLLQTKEKSSLKDEIKQMDSIDTCRKDLDTNNTSDQEEEENAESASIVHDMLRDLSSNYSINSKLNHGM
ncbi:E3 ubiquitin-protein ligase RAD18 [Eufriesea mexicana]|uniref:RING-type E3 ubiquitin transferase n=1 Tax=Eufriesea mexicana TaxID=516756 RepID=A0A310SBI9_9HYME|nr:E3 ubiquitin-protein ligase RAD18 [Eufriesea mexicana]